MTLSGGLWGFGGGLTQDSEVIRLVCQLLCGDLLEGPQPPGQRVAGENNMQKPRGSVRDFVQSGGLRRPSSWPESR